MQYRFDDIEIDAERFELRRGGETVSVEPLVFNLLLHFVQNPERVFSRDELIDAVWDGRVVSDATVSGAIKHLRKALGDSGEAQKYVKTLHGRGFRFSAELQPGGDSKETASLDPVVRDPMLAVLPILLADEMRQYQALALGLVEDLERILSRIPLLRISGQTSRYAAVALRPTVRQIHDEIGAHFVLEISLRERGGELRANVQLSDARAGFHLWSEQVGLPLGDDDLLDPLVLAVIGRIEPQLNRAIYQLVRDTGGPHNARQLFLEASGLLALKGWHEDSFLEAAGLLRQSIELEPDFAHAWASLALILAFGHRIGLIREREQSVREAETAVARALELERMDSTVLGFAGCALCDIGKTSRGIPILKNAIERNPANGQAWAALGAAYLLEKDLDKAIEHLERGVRISPLDSRLSVWGALLALAHLLAGNLDVAVEQAERACQHDHSTYLPRLVLAAARLAQRAPAEATAALDEAYLIKADLSAGEMAGIVGKRMTETLLALRS